MTRSCADCRHAIVVSVDPPKNEEWYCQHPNSLRSTTLGALAPCRDNRQIDERPGACGFLGLLFEEKA